MNVDPHQRGEFDPSEFVNQALTKIARDENGAIRARTGHNAASLNSVLADRSLNDIERLQKFRRLTNRPVPGQEHHMLSVALGSQPDTWSYLFSQGKHVVYESGSLLIGHGKDFNAYRTEYVAQFFFRPELLVDSSTHEATKTALLNFDIGMCDSRLSHAKRIELFEALALAARNLTSPPRFFIRQAPPGNNSIAYQFWIDRTFLHQYIPALAAPFDLRQEVSFLKNMQEAWSLKNQLVSFCFSKWIFQFIVDGRDSTDGFVSTATQNGMDHSVNALGHDTHLQEVFIPLSSKDSGVTPRVQMTLIALKIALHQVQDAFLAIVSAPDATSDVMGLEMPLTLQEGIENNAKVVPSLRVRPAFDITRTPRSFQVVMRSDDGATNTFVFTRNKPMPCSDAYALRVRQGLCIPIGDAYRQSLRYMYELEKTVLHATMHEMDFMGVSLGQLLQVPRPDEDQLLAAYGNRVHGGISTNSKH